VGVGRLENVPRNLEGVCIIDFMFDKVPFTLDGVSDLDLILDEVPFTLDGVSELDLKDDLVNLDDSVGLALTVVVGSGFELFVSVTDGFGVLVDGVLVVLGDNFPDAVIASGLFVSVFDPFIDALGIDVIIDSLLTVVRAVTLLD